MLKDYFVVEVDGIAIVGQEFLPLEDTGYPVVCLCHGVPSGNPPDPNDGGYPALAETFCEQKYPVYIFNFRGTGDSGGNFEMPGWTRDLQSVVGYILGLENNKNRGLYLVGFSAGAATSIYIASRDNRVGLNVFTKILVPKLITYWDQVGADTPVISSTKGSLDLVPSSLVDDFYSAIEDLTLDWGGNLIEVRELVH